MRQSLPHYKGAGGTEDSQDKFPVQVPTSAATRGWPSFQQFDWCCRRMGPIVTVALFLYRWTLFLKETWTCSLSGDILLLSEVTNNNSAQFPRRNVPEPLNWLYCCYNSEDASNVVSVCVDRLCWFDWSVSSWIPSRLRFIYWWVITDSSRCVWVCLSVCVGFPGRHRRSIVNQQSNSGLWDQVIDSLPGKSIQSKTLFKLNTDQNVEDVQQGLTTKNAATLKLRSS